MKGRLCLFLAALVLFLPAVIGTSHLSFATNRAQVNITRDGCGTNKLCLETPDNCDPTTNTNMCLFMSSDLVMSSSTNENILSFELRGHSQGYIAMGLTMNASQGMAMLFACFQNNSNDENISFHTARRNNSFPDIPPTPNERNVTEIRGVVNDNITKCEFNIPGLNFTNINYTVLLGSGNMTEGSLDTFNVSLTRGPLNLTDPTSGSSNPTTPPPTTPPPTTPAPAPLTITRAGCGTDKLCLETPGNCDPAGNGMCLFTSLVVNNSMSPNGIELSIELRGDSSGYIALGLTPTASPDTAMVFVCAQNSSSNGTFFFRTLQRNNSDPNAALTPLNRTVTNVRGEVNGNVIKCIFTVPNVNSTQKRNAATTFGVLLGSGSVNGASLGTFSVSLKRSSLNLGDPTLGNNNPVSSPPAPLNITRAGCGTDKLCLETPGNCDPAGNSTCLFTSVVANSSASPNGAELSIELRGDSSGYIALGLIPTASPDTAMVFACAQNSSSNGTFFFRTLERNNSDPNAMLTPLNRTVTNVRGEVNGNVIKCIFKVPNVNSTQKRNAATTFTVLLGSGSVNGTSLGIFNVSLTRGPLNLADPTLGNSPTQAPNVTTQSPPSTTSDAVSSYPHALLLLSVLVLSIMLRN